MEERKTKIESELLKNLILDNNTTKIKLFMIILNKSISKYYGQPEYSREIERELSLPMSFVNKYKGASKLTTKEIVEFIKEINISIRFYDDDIEKERSINVIEECAFDEYVFNIIFNETAIEYMLMISEKYTIIDLEVLKELTGKYEIGLYAMYCMYKNLKHKSKIYKVPELKKFLGVRPKKNSDLIASLNNAISKLDNLGIEIGYSTQKERNKIIGITFTFKKIKE